MENEPTKVVSKPLSDAESLVSFEPTLHDFPQCR